METKKQVKRVVRRNSLSLNDLINFKTDKDNYRIKVGNVTLLDNRYC